VEVKVKNLLEILKITIINTEFENKVFIAGGFVRDKIMDLPTNSDIDIVVNIPDGGIKLAKFLHKELNTSNPVIFERFGTAQIVLDGIDLEFVETRKEIYNFESRNPETSFGSIRDDVFRRDFTINSLLLNISTGKILDLTERGIEDIKLGIIKTTSNPNIIFKEDPLRILRAIRFASRFGFAIEKDTFQAITEHVSWLEKISKERINAEFSKILISKNFILGLQLLKDTGILSWMIPEFSKIDEIKKQGKHHGIKTLWEHTLEVLFVSKNTVEHRLAALLHDIGKISTLSLDDSGDIHFFGHQHISSNIAKRFLKDFKFNNEQIEKIVLAIKLHMDFISEIQIKTLRKKILQHSKENMLFAIDLAIADTKTPIRRSIIHEIKTFILNDEVIKEDKIKLPINGHDIMERFNLKPSKIVGELLKIVEDIFLNNPTINISEIWKELELNQKNK